jgi:hypothetical protein
MHTVEAILHSACSPTLPVPDLLVEKGFGAQPAHYRNYEAGMLVGAGVAFDIWRYGISYSHGLFDIQNGSEIKIKNTVLGIDVAQCLTREIV